MENKKSPARILLFTGDGKGKTTAALGMVLRASGHGQKVFLLQFIKDNSSTGELIGCKSPPRSPDLPGGPGFHSRAGKPGVSQNTGGQPRRAWTLAIKALNHGNMISSFSMRSALPSPEGLLDEEEVMEAIRLGRPGDLRGPDRPEGHCRARSLSRIRSRRCAASNMASPQAEKHKKE